MRWIPTTLAALSLGLLCASCGGEKPQAPAAKDPAPTPASVAFKSEAQPPTGDAIHVKYAYGKGDGVRMTLETVGSMDMDGEAHPMNMSMTLTMKCTDVRDGGDRVLAVGLEGMKLNGEEPPGGLGGDMQMTMTVGADGQMKDLNLDGVDPMIAQTLKKTLQSGGFAAFLPFPPEGLRVGEAIDLAKVIPVEALAKAMSEFAPGSSLKPEVHGEYVLMGTSVIDGIPAAEFKVNMVMSMEGTMARGEQAVHMNMHMTTSGTQYLALDSGFPVGTAHMQMDMDMVMKDESEEPSDDAPMSMSMTMRMAVSSEALK